MQIAYAGPGEEDDNKDSTEEFQDDIFDSVGYEEEDEVEDESDPEE